MDDCLFCKIANGEIPSKKVYEDDDVLAFEDINPQAPVHILVIPKEHIESVNEFNEVNSHIASKIASVIPIIADKASIKDKGYRVVINCGKNAGQEVMHLHYHILGGRSLQWPPG